jgi:small subunit ribosomal protein S3
MGQKVHPIGFRVGIIEDWRSRWYASKREYGRLLVEDQRIRKVVKANYAFAGISRIDIERTRDRVRIMIYTARPGILIGRKGVELEKLKGMLADSVSGEIDLRILEVEQPELDAQLIAEALAEQLVKRAPFRRAIKKSIDTCRQLGAKGVKIVVSGRLGGAEIARREKATFGSVPLHTLTAKIDYGFGLAKTAWGTIGVKVLIYKGKAELLWHRKIEAGESGPKPERG